jgi:hypothetical protein
MRKVIVHRDGAAIRSCTVSREKGANSLSMAQYTWVAPSIR